MKKPILITLAVVLALFCGGGVATTIAAKDSGPPPAQTVPTGGGSSGTAPAQPQTVNAEDYEGGPQEVVAHDHESAVTVKTDAKRECVRYAKRANGSRYCADYKTTPAKTTVTDDEDWYIVLADGTRVDCDAATQARYPVGSVYP